MSIHVRLIVLLTALVTLGLCPGLPSSAALAQHGGGSSNQTQPDAPSGQSAADQAIVPLLKKFQALHSALQSRGGFSEEDRPVIDRLLQQVRAHNRQFPEHETGLALELQLNLWLENTQEADEQFEQLYELSGSLVIGRQWARFHEQQGDAQAAAQIYQRLLEDFPDNTEIRMQMAKQAKKKNRFAEAIQILENADIDFAANPEAAIVLSDCYFAEHEFEKAIEVLDQIPEQTLSSNQSVKRDVEQKRSRAEQYITLWEQEQELRRTEAQANDLPIVELITSKGPITVQLFENQAPNTVANFISLVESGFYEGTKFHRVLENFMAQGGDPNTKPGNEGPAGQGDPGYKIPDEHGRDDARMHFAGSLAMAKSAAPNTAGSQFYLTHMPTPWLNSQHTVFGRVLQGLDIVREIEQSDTLITAKVVRKRDHAYIPEKVSAAATQPETQPATQPSG